MPALSHTVVVHWKVTKCVQTKHSMWTMFKYKAQHVFNVHCVQSIACKIIEETNNSGGCSVLMTQSVHILGVGVLQDNSLFCLKKIIWRHLYRERLRMYTCMYVCNIFLPAWCAMTIVSCIANACVLHNAHSILYCVCMCITQCALHFVLWMGRGMRGL